MVQLDGEWKMSDSIVKCTIRKGGYSETRCDALNSVIDYHPRANSKGIFGRSIVNINSGESLGLMVVAKLGKFQQRGIAMNVCPFCGGSLMDQGE